MAPERLRLILRLLPDSGNRSDNINTREMGAQHRRPLPPARNPWGMRRPDTRTRMQRCARTRSQVRSHQQTAVRANTHPHSHIRMHLCTRCQVRSHECAATCAYRHTRAHTDKHTSTNTVTCSHEHTHTCSPVHTHLHTYIFTPNTYIDARAQTPTNVIACAQTHVHTDIYIYTHTDTGEKKGGCSLHSREGRGIKG